MARLITKDGYFSYDEVLRRGWTHDMICRLLDKRFDLEPNYFLQQRVLDAEKIPEFNLYQMLCRRKVSRTVRDPEFRHDAKKLVNKAKVLPISIKKMDYVDLVCEATHHAHTLFPEEAKDCPEERICVNYLRHQTNYDKLIENWRHHPGRSQAVAIIFMRIAEAIMLTYENLRRECWSQIRQREMYYDFAVMLVRNKHEKLSDGEQTTKTMEKIKRKIYGQPKEQTTP